MARNLESLDILENPVVTKCRHQFCRACFLTYLQRKHDVPCPLCKEPMMKRNLIQNIQLEAIVAAGRNLVEAFKLDSGIDVTPRKDHGSSQDSISRFNETSVTISDETSQKFNTRTQSRAAKPAKVTLRHLSTRSLTSDSTNKLSLPKKPTKHNKSYSKFEEDWFCAKKSISQEIKQRHVRRSQRMVKDAAPEEVKDSKKHPDQSKDLCMASTSFVQETNGSDSIITKTTVPNESAEHNKKEILQSSPNGLSSSGDSCAWLNKASLKKGPSRFKCSKTYSRKLNPPNKIMTPSMSSQEKIERWLSRSSDHLNSKPSENRASSSSTKHEAKMAAINDTSLGSLLSSPPRLHDVIDQENILSPNRKKVQKTPKRIRILADIRNSPSAKRKQEDPEDPYNFIPSQHTPKPRKQIKRPRAPRKRGAGITFKNLCKGIMRPSSSSISLIANATQYSLNSDVTNNSLACIATSSVVEEQIPDCWQLRETSVKAKQNVISQWKMQTKAKDLRNESDEAFHESPSYTTTKKTSSSIHTEDSSQDNLHFCTDPFFKVASDDPSTEETTDCAKEYYMEEPATVSHARELPIGDVASTSTFSSRTSTKNSSKASLIVVPDLEEATEKITGKDDLDMLSNKTANILTAGNKCNWEDSDVSDTNELFLTPAFRVANCKPAVCDGINEAGKSTRNFKRKRRSKNLKTVQSEENKQLESLKENILGVESYELEIEVNNSGKKWKREKSKLGKRSKEEVVEMDFKTDGPSDNSVTDHEQNGTHGTGKANPNDMIVITVGTAETQSGDELKGKKRNYFKESDKTPERKEHQYGRCPPSNDNIMDLEPIDFYTTGRENKVATTAVMGETMEAQQGENGDEQNLHGRIVQPVLSQYVQQSNGVTFVETNYAQPLEKQDPESLDIPGSGGFTVTSRVNENDCVVADNIPVDSSAVTGKTENHEFNLHAISELQKSENVTEIEESHFKTTSGQQTGKVINSDTDDMSNVADSLLPASQESDIYECYPLLHYRRDSSSNILSKTKNSIVKGNGGDKNNEEPMETSEESCAFDLLECHPSKMSAKISNTVNEGKAGTSMQQTSLTRSPEKSANSIGTFLNPVITEIDASASTKMRHKGECVSDASEVDDNLNNDLTSEQNKLISQKLTIKVVTDVQEHLIKESEILSATAIDSAIVFTADKCPNDETNIVKESLHQGVISENEDLPNQIEDTTTYGRTSRKTFDLAAETQDLDGLLRPLNNQSTLDMLSDMCFDFEPREDHKLIHANSVEMSCPDRAETEAAGSETTKEDNFSIPLSSEMHCSTPSSSTGILQDQSKGSSSDPLKLHTESDISVNAREDLGESSIECMRTLSCPSCSCSLAIKILCKNGNIEVFLPSSSSSVSSIKKTPVAQKINKATNTDNFSHIEFPISKCEKATHTDSEKQYSALDKATNTESHLLEVEKVEKSTNTEAEQPKTSITVERGVNTEGSVESTEDLKSTNTKSVAIQRSHPNLDEVVNTNSIKPCFIESRMEDSDDFSDQSDDLISTQVYIPMTETNKINFDLDLEEMHVVCTQPYEQAKQESKNMEDKLPTHETSSDSDCRNTQPYFPTVPGVLKTLKDHAAEISSSPLKTLIASSEIPKEDIDMDLLCTQSYVSAREKSQNPSFQSDDPLQSNNVCGQIHNPMPYEQRDVNLEIQVTSASTQNAPFVFGDKMEEETKLVSSHTNKSGDETEESQSILKAPCVMMSQTNIMVPSLSVDFKGQTRVANANKENHSNANISNTMSCKEEDHNNLIEVVEDSVNEDELTSEGSSRKGEEADEEPESESQSGEIGEVSCQSNGVETKMSTAMDNDHDIFEVEDPEGEMLRTSIEEIFNPASRSQEGKNNLSTGNRIKSQLCNSQEGLPTSLPVDFDIGLTADDAQQTIDNPQEIMDVQPQSGQVSTKFTQIDINPAGAVGQLKSAGPNQISQKHLHDSSDSDDRLFNTRKKRKRQKINPVYQVSDSIQALHEPLIIDSHSGSKRQHKMSLKSLQIFSDSDSNPPIRCTQARMRHQPSPKPVLQDSDSSHGFDEEEESLDLLKSLDNALHKSVVAHQFDSVPANDPDMVFANSLVAPLRKLAASTQATVLANRPQEDHLNKKCLSRSSHERSPSSSPKHIPKFAMRKKPMQVKPLTDSDDETDPQHPEQGMDTDNELFDPFFPDERDKLQTSEQPITKSISNEAGERNKLNSDKYNETVLKDGLNVFSDLQCLCEDIAQDSQGSLFSDRHNCTESTSGDNQTARIQIEIAEMKARIRAMEEQLRNSTVKKPFDRSTLQPNQQESENVFPSSQKSEELEFFTGESSEDDSSDGMLTTEIAPTPPSEAKSASRVP